MLPFKRLIQTQKTISNNILVKSVYGPGIKLFITLHWIFSILEIPMITSSYGSLEDSLPYHAVHHCFTFGLYTILLQDLKVLYEQDANLSGMLSFKNEATF